MLIAIQVYTLTAVEESMLTCITWLVTGRARVKVLLNHCQPVANGLARVSQLRLTGLSPEMLIAVTLLTGVSVNYETKFCLLKY